MQLLDEFMEQKNEIDFLFKFYTENAYKIDPVTTKPVDQKKLF